MLLNNILIHGSWGDRSEVSFDLPFENISFNETLCVIANTELIKIENKVYRDKYPLTFNEFLNYNKNIPNNSAVLWNLKYIMPSKLYHQRC